MDASNAFAVQEGRWMQSMRKTHTVAGGLDDGQWRPEYKEVEPNLQNLNRAVAEVNRIVWGLHNKVLRDIRNIYRRGSDDEQ